MSLRRFNHFLTVAVIALGLYIAVTPFLPDLAFRVKQLNPPENQGAPYTGQLAGTTENREPTPLNNRLVIPSILLDTDIKSGNSISVISNGGSWYRPASAAPGTAGNTVIIGHRFYRSKGSTFYNLDKIKAGDRIGVYWEGKEYVYKVSETKVVAASALEVEAPTADNRLTLYTCTPLWTAKDRLVIIALPEENS